MWLEIEPMDTDILNNNAVAVSKLTPDFSGKNPNSESNSDNAIIMYGTYQLFLSTTITFVMTKILLPPLIP